MNILKCAVLGLGVVVLASCGGGGGSSSGSGGSGDTSGGSEISISLTPASFSEDLVQGLSMDLQFSADATIQPGVSLSGKVFVIITDNKGVIEPNVDVSGSGTHYTATLVTSPKLSVGEHKGSISIQACADAGCKTVYGSTSLSYDFKVQSATNLKTLSALAGASDWQPSNGNPGRTSYVPVTLDASAFSPRWLYTEPATQNVMIQTDFLAQGATLVDNTTNTVTTDSVNNLAVLADGPWLIALDEKHGTAVWSQKVDPHNYGNPVSPALANGVLYTTQGLAPSGIGGQAGAGLTSYDEATGAAGFQTSYSPSQCSRCGTAPVTVVNSQVFVEPDNGGSGMEVFAFDATSGTPTWSSANDVSIARGYAADGTDVYFVDDNSDGLVGLDQATGTQQFSVPAVDDRVLSLDSAGTGAIAVAGDKFVHVDLVSQSVDWSSPVLPDGAIITSNAVSDDAFYIGMIDQSSFQASVVAYSSTDGHQLWSWSPTSSGDAMTAVLSVIATKNLLFVSTNSLTYAINVKTQAVMWTYPLGGGLSISPTGILYIQGSGNVAAVNLD